MDLSDSEKQYLETVTLNQLRDSRAKTLYFYLASKLPEAYFTFEDLVKRFNWSKEGISAVLDELIRHKLITYHSVQNSATPRLYSYRLKGGCNE